MSLSRRNIEVVKCRSLCLQTFNEITHKLWRFYHNETVINSSLQLHIYDAITTSFLLVLSYLFFFPFDLATRNQISKNLFINDLHTSCFYLPTRTTQDHPLSLGQSTSISILLVRRTNYCDCIRSWLASWIIIKSSSSVQSLGCRYSAL